MSENIIHALILPSVRQFIIDHEHSDEQNLILKHKTIQGIPSRIIAEQINGRRKAKIKLPTLYQTQNIVYPPGVNLEQTSSEITAKFKAGLFDNGGICADLTGGLGIDTFLFSLSFKEVHYVEPDHELLNIAKHNHHQLKIDNIHYHPLKAENFLEAHEEHIDLIYFDPSRRTKRNQKAFKLSDCDPDVTVLLSLAFKKTNTVLVKTSPLLDIQQALKELNSVEKVFVVSVQNECKEVLFLCRKGFSAEPTIEAVNITNDHADKFHFIFSDERAIESAFSKPLPYLYEPNTSILKAGAFKSIAVQFNLYKLHSSTHLYTSEKLVDNFPGRIFKQVADVKPDPKIIKPYLPESKANVITRNYPLSPDQLKKRIGLTDGGEKYLIGFSGIYKKYLLVADRLQ